MGCKAKLTSHTHFCSSQRPWPLQPFRDLSVHTSVWHEVPVHPEAPKSRAEWKHGDAIQHEGEREDGMVPKGATPTRQHKKADTGGGGAADPCCSCKCHCQNCNPLDCDLHTAWTQTCWSPPVPPQDPSPPWRRALLPRCSGRGRARRRRQHNPLGRYTVWRGAE